MVEFAVVGNVQLVALMVAAADSYNLGIALCDFELELILRHGYSTAFAVNGLDAEMHQISTISFPSVIFRSNYQFHSLTRGLYLMTSHFLPVAIGDGQQFAV